MAPELFDIRNDEVCINCGQEIGPFEICLDCGGLVCFDPACTVVHLARHNSPSEPEVPWKFVTGVR